MNATKVRIDSRWLHVFAIVLVISPMLAVASDTESALQQGKELFERRFVLGQPLPPGGDGLGPMFNHESCAACHLQGGVGGGGPIDVNVLLLSAQLVGGKRPGQKALVTALKALHPAFVSADDKIIGNIILHRFGIGGAYDELMGKIGGLEVSREPNAAERDTLQRQLAAGAVPTVHTKSPLQLVRTQRNTTALFGAGLIDQIPDAVLHNLAATQAKQGDVSGRVPPIGPERVGRFGWRGQQEHLHDFVLGACANELGLEVPGNSQPQHPLYPNYRPKGLDLTAGQCRSLTAFVASLPPPRVVEPAVDAQQENIAHGHRLFESVGCAACHIERIGPIDGIYGDLLLHDMGPALADPVVAEATLVFVKQLSPGRDDLLTSSTVKMSIPRNPRPEPVPQPSPPGNYYGGSSFQGLAGNTPSTVKITDTKTDAQNEYRVQPTSLDREWRTPPLWGVADSAPYLHDGRAATLLEAIALHGGEADASTKRFFGLAAGERFAILEFLNCLKSP